MNWMDVWKIVFCAIGSAGGIGAIIVIAIKFSANTIAERVTKNYEWKLQKELEKYKTLLEEKNYSSKLQFELEFESYKIISCTLFDTIKAFNSAFSPDYNPGSQPGQIYAMTEQLISIAKKLQNAQDELNKKSAFMPITLYEKIDKIIENAQDLFWECKEAIDKESNQSDKRTVEWMKEKYHQVEHLDEERKQLNTELREYLQSKRII